MEYSRRDVVRAAGISAAAAGLSCASASTGTGVQNVEERARSVQYDEQAKPPEIHTVEVHARQGQYVVVESKSPNSRSGTFRGKIEMRWGDKVRLHNVTGRTIRVVFPQPEIFDPSPKMIEEVEHGPPVEFTLSSELDKPGRYEYAVLYKKEVLRNVSEGYEDGAEWGIAIGGSSAEFIIRRPPGPT
jgi:hypothetical protein